MLASVCQCSVREGLKNCPYGSHLLAKPRLGPPLVGMWEIHLEYLVLTLGILGHFKKYVPWSLPLANCYSNSKSCIRTQENKIYGNPAIAYD